MTQKDPRDVGAARLPDDAAHRVLARAIELDAARVDEISIAQLRDIARETGISAEAFEAALRETRLIHASSGAKPGVLHRLWRRLHGDQEARRPSVLESIASNAAALLAFWLILTLSARLARTVGGGWQVFAPAMIVACALGAAVAHRLGARLTMITLAGLGVAQLGEYVMHLIYGIRTVQGGATHWAMIIAGVLGVGLGAAFSGGWRRAPGASGDEAGAPESSRARDDEHGLGARSTDRPGWHRLRLGLRVT